MIVESMFVEIRRRMMQASRESGARETRQLQSHVEAPSLTSVPDLERNLNS